MFRTYVSPREEPVVRNSVENVCVLDIATKVRTEGSLRSFLTHVHEVRHITLVDAGATNAVRNYVIEPT